MSQATNSQNPRRDGNRAQVDRKQPSPSGMPLASRTKPNTTESTPSSSTKPISSSNLAISTKGLNNASSSSGLNTADQSRGTHLDPSSAHSQSSIRASQVAPATMTSTSPALAIDSCVFCKVMRGEIPSTLIQDWPDAICIIPLDPCAPGHVLVIPKKHVMNGEEEGRVSGATIARAMERPHELMMRAMQHLQEPLPPSRTFDYNTQFSRGECATQTVFHLHVHLVPRFKDDGLPLPWTGQIKGHYNTTGKPTIKDGKCKGLPDDKKCPYCKKKQLMSKGQQLQLKSQGR